MRQVVGKRVDELSPERFAELRAGRRLTIDIGTGDGKHVLHAARAKPDEVVVGLDASRDGLAAVSTRAAAKPARGGAPNAVFVWAPVEQWPAGLAGADEVHVLMPWGSLLRGMLGLEPVVLANVRSACAPAAQLLVTLNLHAWRPPVPEVGAAPEPDPDSVLAPGSPLARGYAEAGLRLDGAEYLDAAGVQALATSWSRRLTSSRAVFDVLAVRGHAVSEPA